MSRSELIAGALQFDGTLCDDFTPRVPVRSCFDVRVE
jgi:hypothetical protein